MSIAGAAIGRAISVLNWFGAWLPQLVLRVLLAWEFWEAGVEKYRGANWFADIQERFPFPFSVVPVDVSWKLATWTELLAPILLVLGLGTRMAGIALAILTVVAIAAVHWPSQWQTVGDLLKGYVISDDGYGNFKLPLLFMAMLLPLILSGPGRLSIDRLIERWYAARR
jgi:putative oxidoreductase